uniref:Uncharacterized protein n=1 Tax=Avena sativa TaxID=4498 RepID=A0ACD6AGQ7_AVESA
MLRWVWRIQRDDGGLWIKLIKAKYLRGRPLLDCDRRDGSQFWHSVQEIKNEIRLGAMVSIGNGEGTMFWMDSWLGGRPLREVYPSLFAICSDPTLRVSSAAREGTWNISFRRTFGPKETEAWRELRAELPDSLADEPDRVSWSLSPSGSFSVSSAHRALFGYAALPWTKPLWKAPLPLKTKFFVWQLLRDRLPSGVEVSKRHGPGDGLCPLCGIPETGAHIMFACPAARFLWSFIRDALGPDWQTHDLGEFLETQANQAGKGRRLFWLVFVAMSWSLWNIRNKMTAGQGEAGRDSTVSLGGSAAAPPIGRRSLSLFAGCIIGITLTRRRRQHDDHALHRRRRTDRKIVPVSTLPHICFCLGVTLSTERDVVGKLTTECVEPE